MMRLAVLEDEPELARLMQSVTETAGYYCHLFRTGTALRTALGRETFDLLILDWNVPDMTGLDILNWAAANVEHRPPVLFVTSRSDEADIVQALNAGADDYVVKPFRTAELLARMGALLRRHAQPAGTPVETFGRYRFDSKSFSVTIDGEPVVLTQKEFELGLVFFRNLDRALSRAYLLEKVWGQNPDLLTRTLDVHVSRIRVKLGLRPEQGFRLAPVYAFGYRLESLDGAVAQS